MVYQFQGPYSFTQQTVANWKSNAVGVYYCGYQLKNGNLFCHYVGQACGAEGIRGRLLQHLAERKWSDVTHFGFALCDTSREAATFEAQEIRRLQPKYNIQGKHAYG